PKAHKKGDGTWVTEADWAAEAQIRLRIARVFPEHNILGEEEGLTAAGGGKPAEGAPCWIVDPIDGTNNFISGIPIWATLIALRVDDVTIAGVAQAPALGELYEGAIDLGARLNGTSIFVSTVDRIKDASFAYAGVKDLYDAGLQPMFESLTSDCKRSRGFGDFWGHMLVARGAMDIMIEPELNLWDVAALQPIVSEAGGRLTDLSGGEWRTRGPCITTNSALHDHVLRLSRTG
ncbi:MAG: inositol monophosphatase, partial [Actinomycetota bacterium]